MGDEIFDTLRTSGTGLGGFWLSTWNLLPDIISLSVGVATLVYLIVKIKREFKKR